MNDPELSERSTALTRVELKEMLDRLNADIPQLVIEYPRHGDFVSVFASRSDAIMANVSHTDSEWATAQIASMLAPCGYQSEDDELQVVQWVA